MAQQEETSLIQSKIPLSSEVETVESAPSPRILMFLTLLQEYRTLLQHDTKNLQYSLESVVLPVWTSADWKEYSG